MGCRRVVLSWAVLVLWCGSVAGQELVFEAETVAGPASAWQANRDSADRWNLWSNDQDAAAKWSGGVVFRSPMITADRERPEDGAPPLRVELTGVPAGSYDVSLKVSRTLAVSLDGETWQRFKGGVWLSGVTIEDGRLVFWVDDRFLDDGGPGPCYFDNVTLTATIPAADGVRNPGFEVPATEGVPGWSWWSREGGGSAVVVTGDARGGQQAVRIQHEGERDWAFTCGQRTRVTPGEAYDLTGWVKAAAGQDIRLTLVALSGGKLVSWDIGSQGTSAPHDWRQLTATAYIMPGVDEVYLRVVGHGDADFLVDDVSLRKSDKPALQFGPKPKVKGWATGRLAEKLDRGVVALPCPAGVYVSWRLLASDHEAVAFNVYRHSGDSIPVKINAEPITRTCDVIDTDPPETVRVSYAVRAVLHGRELAELGRSQPIVRRDAQPYLSVRLNGDHTFQKIGLVDLNGDGRLDYVIKQPNTNIDPWHRYWRPSEDTYKVEAYLDDGTFLWRQDLGWGIEQGIWYSPVIAWDLTGDGKAEVCAKIGEGDPRDPDGKVTGGAEYVVVWDGETGAEIARAPWPDREGFGGGESGYNYASRNQIAVAYLDGKTPCLILLRGTYTRMKAEAYQINQGQLEQLWTYVDLEGGPKYRGQGAHFTHCVDVDGDGRDEIILGSAVLDDDGTPLWSTGRGHPDHLYLGDLDPLRPGHEIYYGIETRQQNGGMLLCDLATGEEIWGWGEPTVHIHGSGMCADLDPTRIGYEMYGADSVDHKKHGDGWFWNASGELISRAFDFGFGQRTIHWDADLQAEILRGGRVYDHEGLAVSDVMPGSWVLTADVIGDWREELIVSRPGEIRIYSTTIPAADRRVTFLQDPFYRSSMMMCMMGYPQNPLPSYYLGRHSHGLNLTVMDRPGADQPVVRVVVQAALERPWKGIVKLSCQTATLSLDAIPFDLPAGERLVREFAIAGEQAGEAVVLAVVEGGEPLTGQATVRLPERPLTGVPMTQAETFTGQGGGEVQVRDDKVGHVGQSLSHWDEAGHWLSWTIRVPEAGRYRLVARYSAAADAARAVSVNGEPVGRLVAPGSGGFGSRAEEWLHAACLGTDGRPLLLSLPAGEATIRMENTDGKGLNLDYLALTPVR